MAVPLSTHVFRFAGGFAIMELLAPNGSALLNPTPVSTPPSPPKTGTSSPAVDKLWSWWGNSDAKRRRAVYPTTLEQDMARYSQGHKWATVGVATGLVFCGSNAAIAGAIVSVVFSGDSGKERYVSVKRWVNDHSQSVG